MEQRMRITELNLSQWELRPEHAARERRAERELRTATIASQLDQNPRDGWIDDYDLPYDQLELLQRARAVEAVQAARHKPRVEGGDAPPAPAVPPPQRPPGRVDVMAPINAQPEPQVDLLA